MNPSRYRYIVVEGPIGAGKTSLSYKLAEHLDADTLLENASDNPFLQRFYQEPARYALSTQLHFLFDRSRQLRELAQGDLFRAGTVSDFLIDKDMLFARLNLDDDEFDLYQKVYADLALQAPTPDLVIYLQAPVEVLQERVKRRGVEFERGMDAGYLQRLANSYSEFFHRYEAAPLLIVNTSHLNFVENEADFELLLERMDKMRGPREFFSRAA
ncbi:MAG: deoxynucleoside kinase [Thiobacillus sp. 63-78]|uniref:deoxynucleoside kinase n=1 Tax=Thiobacillus sp. 63-78 TaxID=1895859 RepID=UPI00095EC278|nr:deoxynucleoside kinase [Thiobacillus sp. 63-78]MBN8763385.1 deoxynucleoside kinase [Thiobacillus sp.]MBN8774553.1 deoxynucleoside kinase [Thiobacillus sp.]OJZ12431.1 MAG: deoxynucleoside kinase [Thiobacillus sp. 63-78]